ncbi:MAG TPA: tRNA (guanosine(37)-N1)-methyltransferase TrmD [Syntrophales bacterium]|jgi:tRNA (guanine37-N1)-methyltransferase|nr:tRNA (guanosine(37)-N1)-methyltransferase TrmD [Syntrophales bacterium]HON22822.1 tRNA (guanosine(37)-N1)-methyltransferase TrmD [Syntrophales bacterium]HOU78809.1 tRNA (guanosine(37)-N1)-methyltransferase TrmD [Syntrophales bacterium]HPC31592.1 tRNA (guanosine(37)-N1)-methyltransferase TrmD [Syntrophales bacterium]HQG34332.1 tRNA (guanosine(37)-N1)-methyltransferase TrmD [Syntrophales bacterium]
MRFDILTLFPEMFASPFASSILGKAQERGLIGIHVTDIRMYAPGKHRVTDDAPYGGGGGMVMKVEPLDRALSALALAPGEGPVILLTPQGKPFCQKIALELAGCRRLVLICGHYEGVDERVREHLVDLEISIGDFILTGGEPAAMVVVDAVARLVPGVLGNSESARTDSFSAGLLEYPQYTRPQEYRGWEVPEVLVNGNHREIDNWRRRQSLLRTWRRRPELLAAADLSAAERSFLQELAVAKEKG